jgi:hypothetical protein
LRIAERTCCIREVHCERRGSARTRSVMVLSSWRGVLSIWVCVFEGGETPKVVAKGSRRRSM